MSTAGNRYVARTRVDKGRKRNGCCTRKLSRLQWDILLDLANGRAPSTERTNHGDRHSEAKRTASLRALARLQQRGLVTRLDRGEYMTMVSTRSLYLAAADSQCPYAVAIAPVLGKLADERQRRGR